MKTTYTNSPLLQKGYPTPFWIALQIDLEKVIKMSNKLKDWQQDYRFITNPKVRRYNYFFKQLIYHGVYHIIGCLICMDSMPRIGNALLEWRNIRNRR